LATCIVALYWAWRTVQATWHLIRRLGRDVCFSSDATEPCAFDDRLAWAWLAINLALVLGAGYLAAMVWLGRRTARTVTFVVYLGLTGAHFLAVAFGPGHFATVAGTAGHLGVIVLLALPSTSHWMSACETARRDPEVMPA
jgi:hypothetical protein